MEIVRIKASLLEPNTGQVEGLPSNPREWTQSDIDRIKKSLKETPELFEARPCLVYEQDGKYIILGGNLRFEGAKRNKAKDIPCIVFPHDTPVDKLKEIVVKDNGAFGAWDMDMLANEWGDLPLEDWGVPAWESPTEAESTGGSEKEAQEDDYDTEQEVPSRVKRGEIWQLGEHRLMCGDSTSAEDVERLMGGQKADLAFTDPPYGISVVGNNGKIGGDNIAKTGDYAPVIGDETTETAQKAFEILKEVSNEQMIWGGNYFTDFLPFSDSWVIWDKRGDAPSNNFADGEMCWCSFHTRVRIFKYLWMGMIQEGQREKRVHPTQKPIGVIEPILSEFTNDGDLIIDLFGGSGSTLIACEQLNRKARLMELDEHYCDVIIDRWETLTGKTAEKITD